jgi:hypothetical protein
LNKGIDVLGEDRINNILAKWIGLPASAKTFTFTEQEKAWLAEHKDIRLGVNPTWPPFEFLDHTFGLIALMKPDGTIIRTKRKLKKPFAKAGSCLITSSKPPPRDSG